MSTTRPRLKLDEQSFQGLLAAAFTIQEHNDKKRALAGVSEPVAAVQKVLESLCSHCAAPLPEGEPRCPQCGSDRYRPGERMQRKYASLWEMSQEQVARQSDPADVALEAKGPATVETPAPPKEIRIIDVQEESAPTTTDWFSKFPELTYLQGDPAVDAATEEEGQREISEGTFERLRKWLERVPKADLYLGIAILVAAIAIVWPSPTLPQKPRLEPWQRILVKMGLAEAPPAGVHYRGDPNVQVWVDPHTALYYCPGEEQYGKTTDGRYAAQREAQLEQFEPAGRAICQ